MIKWNFKLRRIEFTVKRKDEWPIGSVQMLVSMNVEQNSVQLNFLILKMD